jgi:glucan phosphoethanolaminetransferase (alkaline phosphatase superfamily)
MTNQATGIKKYSGYILAIIFTSFVINYSLGYHGAKGIDIFFVALVLITISFFPKAQKIILPIILILLAIYFPVGYLYGQPSLSITASLLQTNKTESLEFIKSIPPVCYALPLLVLASFILLTKFPLPIHTTHRSKVTSLLVFLIFSSILEINGKLSKIKIIDYVASINKSFNAYSKQIEQLHKGNINAKWDIELRGGDTPENVVLIIGESMRTDYMSAFGYPLPTTPFLSDVKGTFYRNYVSTAPNTFLSLPRTLALSTGDNVDISYNIVNLAKQAGFETFWLSNQGFLGDFDLPTSKLATYSDHQIFLKKGDFESLNTDDNSLLPYFKKALNSSSERKFITLHIMGSHPQFIDRLNGSTPFFTFPNKDISNYISTYRKTDDFIKSVYKSLKVERKPFTLIYFSDHGLSERKIDGEFYLRHGSDKKENYNIPLVILSNNDSKRQYINSYKSAYNFISLFSKILGAKITFPKVQNWDDDKKPVQVFNGKSMIEYGELGNEPAEILTN